jgi:D-glycero-D-manno-heptose 1,7-bisphosphate phosphatase
MPAKAVFLDRDNTLIADPGYIADPDAVRLLPGVEKALRSLAHAGYRLVVVTNQSGVARGMLSEETLQQIHHRLQEELEARDVRLDAIYYCPYHPEGTIEKYAVESDLRKPQPGMLLSAAAEIDLDLARCWMVGDSPRDIEAGQRAGCRTIRVRLPEHGGDRPPAEDEDAQADFTVRNLVDASRIILREDTPREDAKSAEPSPPGGGTEGYIARQGNHEHPPASRRPLKALSERELLLEIARTLHRLSPPPGEERFRAMRMFSGVLMVVTVVFAVLSLVLAGSQIEKALVLSTVSVSSAMLALLLYAMDRLG